MVSSGSSPVPANYEAAHSTSEAGFGLCVGPIFIDRAHRKIAFRVRDEHVNPVGLCHGGALATFADSQSIAVHDPEQEGVSHAPTISLTIDYIAPVPLGSLVEMHVELARRTRTLIFTQGLMTVGDNVVARTHGIFRCYDGKE